MRYRQTRWSQLPSGKCWMGILFMLLANTALATTSPALATNTPFDRGTAALAAGQPRVARVEFMNAVQAAPADPRPHVMLARTFILLGDGVGAEAELRLARALAAQFADTRHLLAQAMLLQGAPDRALTELAAGPSRFPAAVARTRARALAALGRTGEAGPVFAAALALAPRDAALWLDVARYRLQTGERAGAIVAADRALALGPNDVAALVLRGTLVRTQYGLKAALPWFERAAAIDPEHAPAWVEQAATLGDLGRTADMLAAARRALVVQPGNGDARYLQAVLAARAGKYTLAQSILQRVSGAAAARPGALLLGGIVDLQLGNAEQAIGRLNALVSAQPGNLAARRLLGLAHVRGGNGRAALAVLRPLEGEAVADAYASTLIAAAYAQSGERPAAARALARASGPGGGSGLLPTNLVNGLDTSAYVWAAQVRRDLHMGRGWSARGRARAIYERNRGAPEALLIAGDAALLTGDAGGAAADYRRAANIAFTQSTALRLVEALQMSGRTAEARTALALFLDQNPQSLAGLRLLANLRLAAGDWAGAAEAYDAVRVRTGDGDAALLSNLAWARYEAGTPALGAAARAYAVAPRNAATADVYGWMLFKSGRDRARALALLHRAAG